MIVNCRPGIRNDTEGALRIAGGPGNIVSKKKVFLVDINFKQ